ncbi:hypothetical protein D3C77_633820 [compost metagenome]
MIPDPGQGQRMQHLDHQRGDAADQHRGEVAVYSPAHRVRAEQAGIPLGVFHVDAGEGKPTQAEHMALDALAQEFHRGRLMLLGGPVDLRPTHYR